MALAKTHVTMEHVKNFIKSKEFIQLGSRTTVCHVILQNGMEVVGTAIRQSTTVHNEDIGNSTAFENALDDIFQIVIASHGG